LRARVAAAEARQADVPQTVLLGRLDQRIRRAKLKRRWTGAAVSAVAVAAAIALPLVLLPPGPATRFRPKPGAALPPSGSTAIPRSWAPVALGDAQVSVPANWLVTSTPQCGRDAPGYVQLRGLSNDYIVQNPRCQRPPDMVAIELVPKGQDQTRRRSGQINGVRVLRVQPAARGFASYLAPTLHVVVSVKGPLANKVLGTLTRSPLSVVLARGRQFPVPRSWRWHEFRGIRFAAPGDWALVRDGHYACPFGLSPNAVILIPAGNRAMPRCGGRLGTAGTLSARFGVTVTAGPYVSEGTAQFHGCTLRHRMRQCYSAPLFGGGVLHMTVFAPGRQRATLVEIGLAGDGMIARTIVESIRPQ
jgi:hypothetical protein